MVIISETPDRGSIYLLVGPAFFIALRRDVSNALRYISSANALPPRLREVNQLRPIGLVLEFVGPSAAPEASWRAESNNTGHLNRPYRAGMDAMDKYLRRIF